MLCGIKPGLLFFEELPVEAALDITGEQACCRCMKPGLQATDMLSGGAGAAWQKPRLQINQTLLASLNRMADSLPSLQ